MKRIASLVILAGLVVACAPPGGDANSGKPSLTPTKPTGETVKLSGNLDVAVFEGGYKLDFYEKAGEELGKANPGVTVKVWGGPRVWEQLRPKFLSNAPPDVTWPGWGMDYWALVYGGQVMDMNEALDGPAYDGSGKWRDTFDPKILKLGEYEGKQYMLPHHINLNGWWYSPTLFKQHGWEVPKTYEELLALAPKIKEKGVAPITFQGKYPYYMQFGFLFPWVISNGGIEALDAAFNLEPGAWKSPAFVRAAQMIAELRDKGFFANGALALSHTESQTDFLNRKAAFLPCGTWLYSEMKDVMPEGADLAFMRVPVPASAKNPTAMQAGMEPWIIPSKAKNPDAGIAYYKYITSVEKSKEFVMSKGTLTAIKGSDDVELPPHLVDAAKAMREAEVIWSADYKLWYPTLSKESENAMAALLGGEISPEQFCDRCEAAATAVRVDAKIPKHKVLR